MFKVIKFDILSSDDVTYPKLQTMSNKSELKFSD